LNSSTAKIVFNQACAELGLSNTLTDKGEREHLAMLMVSLIEEGADDLAAVREQAVCQMQHPN
jgi:hypothetical protein